MTSTDCISWVLYTVRTESLRCILPKFSLDYVQKERSKHSWRWWLQEDTSTWPFYLIICALSFTEQDEVTFQHGKMWELSTQNVLSPQLTREGPISCLLCHTKSHPALFTVLSIKAKHFPLLRDHLAWIMSGGCFFLPFISGNIHCSQDSSFSHVFL